ncbi:MAG: hypothetical protein GTN78_24320 [Gemmatimonadales bacterium]|nr:hypothetical protein [Gemmatimonadales bacterium]NIN12053.1 hypothetical protein [Gemmatimonadales bacterium]NIR03288.1 hypothetical protein [Gemmatimonadales bacterium]NIS66968.1 hypothetical protein [Gemmatimonadales bacterium]
MKQTVLAQAIAVALATPLAVALDPAAASSSPQDSAITRVASMEIDIWPEYDDPRVLLIYQGKLEPGVQVPRKFTFLIPRGAQIHMAGAIGDRGEHLHALFETRPLGETLTEVSYQLATPNFYMEFYYDPLTEGVAREFRYPVVSPHAVARLSVRVQRPLRAEAFRTSPAALDVVEDAKGFNYHRFIFENLPPNEERTVAVSYRKPDRTPSVSNAAANGPTGGSAMKNILIVSGILLVGVVGYGVFAGSRKGRVAPVRTSSPEAGRHESVSSPDASLAQRQYCTQCGSPVARTDKFCSGCGARARR